MFNSIFWFIEENASEFDLSELLAEIKILKEANKEQHPNIIKFIGSCFMKGEKKLQGMTVKISSQLCQSTNTQHHLDRKITTDTKDRSPSHFSRKLLFFLFSGRLLMVTEFCPGGNLRKFLIKSRITDNSLAGNVNKTSESDYININSTLSHRQLLKFAVDVACGMVHLSSQNVEN